MSYLTFRIAEYCCCHLKAEYDKGPDRDMWAVLGCVSPEESGATGEDWVQDWARTPAPHLAPPPTAPHPHTHAEAVLF